MGLHRACARGRHGWQIIEEALAYPGPQSTEAFQAKIDGFMSHDALDRLPQITARTAGPGRRGRHDHTRRTSGAQSAERNPGRAVSK